MKFVWSKKYLHASFIRFLQTTACGRCQHQKKNVINIRNNFKFKNLIRSETDIPDNNHNNNRTNLVTADPQNLRKRKQRLPSLGYRGEIVHGIHPVYLALVKGRRMLYQLFMKDPSLQSEEKSEKNLIRKKILDLGHSLGIKVTYLTSQGLNYLTPDVVHQGVCLDASIYTLIEYEETEKYKCDSLSSKHPVWLVLDEVKDPMNVGAILRSAHYFGVDRIFVTAGNSAKLSPVVSKASSGALELLDIFKISNLVTFLTNRKLDGWDIVSTIAYKPVEECSKVTDNILDLNNYKMTKPTILILGNEGVGISPPVMSLCDHLVSIHPQKHVHEGVDSLNVSVATGILLHHMLYTRANPSL